MGLYVFKLPDLGEGTTGAEIVAWRVTEGDAIGEDQPLVDVMTDKATVEITSPVAGRVAKLFGQAGDTAAVGSALVEIDTEGEAVDAEREVDAVQAPAPRPDPVRMHSRTPPPPDFIRRPAPKPLAAGERPLASPAVRQKARELGLDLRQIAGSGPAGRIERADIEGFQPVRPAATGEPRLKTRDGVREVKIIGLRRKIAEKMQAAKRHIPHITYVEEIDVTELEALRQYLNSQKLDGAPRLTLLPFFVRALAQAICDHPQINARYDDEAGVLTEYDALHLGIATQTPGGLMVPVVRHAEALDLFDCAAEIQRVTQAAREGKAAKSELSGSTLTLTSLGTLGGLVHTPVINWPEVAIVGPNRIVERPVVRDGKIEVRKMMNLSSSFDHRIVDGWDAARFVQNIKGRLEHPATLFMS